MPADRLTLALAQALGDLSKAITSIAAALPSESTYVESQLLLDVQAFAVKLQADAERLTRA